MEIAQTFPLLPGDPRLIDHIVCELKNQGIFDQFRKECISDVDTKPAYQNLRQRVECSVTGFLSSQKWRPDLNKNQLREKLRKHILDSNFLEQGVERIVDQVVNPKIATHFLPQVEEIVYKCFGLEKPDRSGKNLSNGLPNTSSALQVDTDNLLPHDLEAVSPDSVKSHERSAEAGSLDPQVKVEEEEEDVKMVEKKEETEVKVERTFPPSIESEDSNDSKDDDFESPAFEPIEDDLKREVSPNISQMSGVSDLNSRDSNDSSSVANEMAVKSEKKKSDLKAVESTSHFSNDSNSAKIIKKTGIEYDSGDDANMTIPVKMDIIEKRESFKFNNDDNSTDARQSFETNQQVKDVNMEYDCTERGQINRRELMKSAISSEATEPIVHHRSSVESKTSSESNKAMINMDASMDSNDGSKSSSIFTSTQNETFGVKETYTFTNKISSMDERSMDDDSSSNGLKIDLQETAEYTEVCINRLSISASEDIPMSEKSPTDDAKAQDSKEKSDKHRDGTSDDKSRSKESERRSSSSHHHSKDRKDRRDDSKHHSRSSHSKHSSSRHDDKKHGSSSSHERKDSSHSKSYKDSHGKSSSSELRKNSKERHSSSSHKSSSSYKHGSSKSSSSSKHHSDDPHKHRHSTSDKDKHPLSRNDSKDSHKSDRESKHESRDSSKDSKSHSSSKHGEKSSEHSSHDKGKLSHSTSKDKSSSSGKHSQSSSDKSRKSSSSHSSGDKKQDEKKGKEKAEKDDHYSSSGRGGRPRRSTDRDSNDGNNGSMKSSSSNSVNSSMSTAQSTANKDKTSSGKANNSSNGNSSSGQSDNVVSKDKINITAGSYIKSGINMFQPIVKKPVTPHLNLHRSPDAVVKKPVIHIDSQLNPSPKLEEEKKSPTSPVSEGQKLKKPKFASNIYEARKLMKVRKNMDIEERKRKQDAQELVEKQNNVSKNESQIYSGNSGPELEIACMKDISPTPKKSFKSRRSRDSSDLESDLHYFDDESKKKSFFALEKQRKYFKQFLNSINGINQKQESIIYLVRCDEGMEQAFNKLSRKNHTIKTVNIERDGILPKEDFKHKVSPQKLDMLVDSEIQLPSSSQCFVELNDLKHSAYNDIMKSKQLPLKKRKIAGRKIVKSIEIKPNIVVEIKPYAVEEKIMPKYYYDDENMDNNAVRNDSAFEYDCPEYYSQINEALSKVTRQDILEVILGGGINFDSSVVDLKRVNEVAEVTKSQEQDVEDMNIDASSNGKTQNRKRKISFKPTDEYIEPKLNHNNNLKLLSAPSPAKRKNVPEIVSSTDENGPLSTTNKIPGMPPKSILVNGLLGRARRIGLSRGAKTLSGLIRNKITGSQNIPSGVEGNKSIENHIDLFPVKSSKDFKENAEDINTTTLNQANRQVTKRDRNCKSRNMQSCKNEKLFETNFMATEQAQ